MNSADMTALQVFEREASLIKYQINRLENTHFDDYTDERLADDDIVDLRVVLSYLEGRIKAFLDRR